jgi:integrase
MARRLRESADDTERPDHRQVLDLAAEAGHWRLLILVLAYTGLCWGEATALRACDINLDRRRASRPKSCADS